MSPDALRLLRAPSPTDVRETMDAAAIARVWASRILASADGLTIHQKQNLYDISRPHRIATINRSPFGLLFDLASSASLVDATWGLGRMKVEIVGRAQYDLPSEDAAHEHEEKANYEGNLAQHRRKERRSRSTLYDLTDTMDGQALASETLAMAAAAGR